MVISKAKFDNAIKAACAETLVDAMYVKDGELLKMLMPILPTMSRRMSDALYTEGILGRLDVTMDKFMAVYTQVLSTTVHKMVPEHEVDVMFLTGMTLGVVVMGNIFMAEEIADDKRNR